MFPVPPVKPGFYLRRSVVIMAVFSLEDEQIVLAFDRLMSIGVVLSSICSSRGAHRLGKIVFPDGQISDGLFVEKFVRSVCKSDDLFV